MAQSFAFSDGSLQSVHLFTQRTAAGFQIVYVVNLLPWHALIDAAQSLNRNVVTWIGSCLVEECDWLTIQGHVFSLESQVTNPSRIIFSIAVIVLEEQVYRRGRVPQGPI